MNRFRILSKGLLCMLLTASVCSYADTAVFMQVDGVEGGAQVAGYEGWIECIGFGHNMERSRILVQHQPIQIVKRVDHTSPALSQKLCNNANISSVRIDFTDATAPSNRFFRIALSNVTVTAVEQQAAASTNTEPTEAVSLSYQLAQWSYTEYTPQGQQGETDLTYGDPIGQSGGDPTHDSDGDSVVDMADPDDDNDGVSDWNEAVAGTSRINDNSFFDINITSINTNRIVISWDNNPGRTYQVLYSTNPVSSSFGNLGSQTTGGSVTADVSYAESAVFKNEVSITP